MSKQPHTEFRIGQRVIVFMRTGGQIIAKYRGKYQSGIILESQKGTVKVETGHIRQVSIYKKPPISADTEDKS